MKEYKLGNTTVFVHSPLLNMSEEEQNNWIVEERKKGNPDLERLTDLVNECYRSFY
ncbi:hypothetical protein NGI46_08175 [Peribacillus butanolivorans]|uniref:hypothetical protein n=1 Tax=Peribacillus butanolivorans TaxID=421767 RepID=UPI00207C3FE5|nr:hypothetical protein [Peribacillus butanolivorans]MCO0597444.1 hypothetical protein [Peribacillus butanolivorans]